MNLMRKPTLLLNAAFEPIRIISARRALTMLCKGVVTVEVPTNIEVHCGITLPSVVRLLHYRFVPVRLQVTTRKNIILRDGGRCMYCGHPFRSEDLTLDHIVPRSRGGSNEWHNLVACCKKDNHRKGDMTPEEAGMRLIHRPLPQNINTPRFLLRSMGSEVEHWRKYLWHDNEGDKRFAYIN